MAALRRVLMRTALPLAEAFLDCRAVVTVVRLSLILSLICARIRIVRRCGAMHEMRSLVVAETMHLLLQAAKPAAPSQLVARTFGTTQRAYTDVTRFH